MKTLLIEWWKIHLAHTKSIINHTPTPKNSFNFEIQNNFTNQMVLTIDKKFKFTNKIMIQFLYFIGLDRIPFCISQEGEVLSPFPVFHGLISKGLLASFQTKGINSSLWNKYAARLGSFKCETQNQEEIIFNNLIEEHGVLSFAQSSITVMNYLKEYCKLEGIKDAIIDVWNIKEGQTSSVWKIKLTNYYDIEFVLNIARDKIGSIDLKNSSDKLRKIGNTDPEINIAKVLDISETMIDGIGSVLVTRNAWIPNSYEIFPLRSTLKGLTLIMAERFYTSKERPSSVVSVLGREFTPSEVCRIYFWIEKFNQCAINALFEVPSFSFEDGDVVWNGEKAIIVALD